MWTLELRRGPFFEPQRPPATADYDEIMAAAGDVESRLRHLVVSRRRYFAIIGVVLLGDVAFIAALFRFHRTWLFYAFGVFYLASASVGAVLRFAYWRQWVWAVGYYSDAPPPLPAVPSPVQVVESLRRLCDALSDASEATTLAAMLAMRESHPLAYQACMRLTVTTSALKRRVRAA